MNPAADGTKVTETDLQLYLAGALPPSKRLMMAWALLVDRRLRAELRALETRNASFRRLEMPRLRSRLYPIAWAGKMAGEEAANNIGPTGGKGGGQRAAISRLFPGWTGARASGPMLAGAFSLIVLCALPWIRPAANGEGGASDSEPAFVAKGLGLGVSLFVKGDSAYRVENQAALVAATDTLQVMPLGSEAQHLVLLGWDARQGLVRLFPKDGNRARLVSRLDPPPALILQDVADNRLICVTAVGPFRIEDAEAALRREPFLPMQKAPASHLHKGLYLQVFSITKSGGRI